MKKRNALIIIIILIMAFGIYTIKADSGWDSDFDVGGSDFGSSDYGSSYSYDGGSSSGGSHSSSSILFDLAVMIIVVIIVIAKYKDNNSSNGNGFSLNSYKDIDEGKLKEIDPSLDIETLKKEVFDIYEKIQIAWMNFDYDTLKKYTTDELYNAYESDLKVLNLKHQKNIMEDIKAINTKIINIKIENNIEIISSLLTIQMYDYVINNKNEVTRGTKKQKIEITYIITLTKKINEIAEKCPRCGAEIKDISSGTCDYCKYKVVNNTSKFVMSKKQNINQRRL